MAHEVNPEDVVRDVISALDDTVWTMSEEDCCTMWARKRGWALGPFKAYETPIARRSPPDGFAASRTPFIPKSCEVDDLGRIVRSPGALRLLTLCNCDGKVITTAFCMGFYRYSADDD